MLEVVLADSHSASGMIMLDFLLNEKDFLALKEYMIFLADLPESLVEINKMSGEFESSGHVLLSPPDAQSLSLAVTANAHIWRTIIRIVPALGIMGCQLVEQASTFVREFKQVTQEPPCSTRCKLLKDFDFQRFTSNDAGLQGAHEPLDVVQLMGNLCLRLDQCVYTAAHFKLLICEILQTVHSVFMRFIESLALRVCTCHPPVPKIEMYYRLGRIALPNMQYHLDGFYTQTQRVEKAREHLRAMDGLYVRTISAGNNISDLCGRMAFFSKHIKAELESNDLQRSIRRARSSLSHIAYPLEELQVMANALVAMSSRFEV